MKRIFEVISILAGLLVLAACASAPATTLPSTQSPTETPMMEFSGDLNFVTQGGPHIIPATETPAQIKPDVPTPALGAQATRENTCVGKDDDGLIFIIVKSILETEGLKIENGVKNLACWFDHPSDSLGNEWYTNEGLPTDVAQLQLITDSTGIPAINYCINDCSNSESPIWEGWYESSTSVPEIWEVSQGINNLDVFSMPFAGAIDYLFIYGNR